nr:NADP-dependent oxidoreductase [uncultured Halomonas sp.]
MQSDNQNRVNRQVLLVKRPQGTPTLDDFKVVDAEVPTPDDGEMLIQTLYLSVDPGMRSMMEEGKSHTTAFELNKPLTGRSVGRVVESNLEGFAEGDYVYERLGWQHYSVSDGSQAQKVDPDVAPLSTYLGIVGVPGFCGYFGILDIGKPEKGQTVVVSGAAGAVGMTAGQIAKMQGCRVVGTAGSQEKIDYLREKLGFDAVINYKTAKDLQQTLSDACPDGIDVYFDNVGGEITQAAMALINYHARIVVCGQTSQYNDASSNSGAIAPQLLIKNSAMMKGFVVYDYQDRNDEAIEQLGQWIKQGKLHYKENVVDGLDNAPQAFIDLFSGKSFGKQLVRLAKEDQQV